MPPTPSWLALLPLPPGLDDAFLDWLLAYVATHLAPRDAREDWLAARIAQAMARLHVSALREPDRVDPVWLRAEAFADRQLREATRAWTAHRKEAPAATADTPPPIAASPGPVPQPGPKPPAPARRGVPLNAAWPGLAAFVDLPIHPTPADPFRPAEHPDSTPRTPGIPPRPPSEPVPGRLET
jgi:hypothetical protein